MYHQSVHLHTLPIFETEIYPEPMQIFANGQWCFYSFMEFYALHSKKQGWGKNLIITVTLLFPPALNSPVPIHKVLANEDTLLRTQMFARLPACATFIADTILCSGTKKKSETFCVCNKCFQVCARKETSWATTCPQQCFLVCHHLFTPGWGETLSVRGKCLAQEHNTMSLASA